MASEWKIVRLCEICDKIGSGATPKGGKDAYGTEGISLIRSQNVLDFAFTDDGLAYINDEQAQKLSNVEVKSGDVLLNITGDSVARACMAEDEYLPARVNQHVAIVRGNTDRVLGSFLLYFLQREKPHLLQLASAGATRNALTKGMIEQLEIALPPLEEQRRIVELLDAIQNKIRTNKKINDNLEQQARALFFEWFIKTPLDCATRETELGLLPADYSVIKTGELPMIVTDYVANGSFASLKENVQLYQERNYAYFIRNTDLKAGTFEVFVDEHSYNFLAKSRLFGGEIIISNVGDVGSVFLCPKLDAPMTLGNNIIMLKPSQEELRYYLYIWFKWSMGQSLMQGIKGGSAQPKFNKTDFKSLPVILPPKDILHRFYETVRPMFEVIDGNQAENRRLAALRDTILPKLMSGEIDVSDIII